MKLNFLIDNKEVLKGYKNIDPFADDPDKFGRIKHDISNLNDFVDDAECEEIRVVNILCYFSHHDIDALLSHWLSKIHHGGIITISEIDCYEVARLIFFQKLTVDRLNSLVFGEQKTNWGFKKSTLSCLDLIAVLESVGFKIIESKLVEYQFVVKGERP